MCLCVCVCVRARASVCPFVRLSLFACLCGCGPSSRFCSFDFPLEFPFGHVRVTVCMQPLGLDPGHAR